MTAAPPALENEVVRLEPLSAAHVPALLAAATAERGTFGFTYVPEDEPSMRAYVEEACAAAASGAAAPIAIVRRADGAVVGPTRLGNLEWWSWPPRPIAVAGEPRRRDAGAPPDAVEIGWTWLARSAQRTAVNTACKLRLLEHAFEAWRVHRVTLKTDARNARSRAGIEGIGARFEGVLRAHSPASDGGIRDTAMYSIVAAEWPDVRRRLQERLGRGEGPIQR